MSNKRKMFATNVDSDGPFSEFDMVNRYDHILSYNAQENWARWLWHAMAGDIYEIGRIVITCIELTTKESEK